MSAAPPPPPGVWAAIILFSVGCAAVPMLLGAAGTKKARNKLQEWAAANQLELIEATVIPRFRGPFRMRGYWTTVFRIKTKTPDRCAWVCTGNFFIWAFTEPDVRWDD